jgi:hypothetical protein
LGLRNRYISGNNMTARWQCIDCNLGKTQAGVAQQGEAAHKRGSLRTPGDL